MRILYSFLSYALISNIDFGFIFNSNNGVRKQIHLIYVFAVLIIWRIVRAGLVHLPTLQNAILMQVEKEFEQVNSAPQKKSRHLAGTYRQKQLLI
ncbi:MAG TPA: hypothetical protein DEO64_08265 [Alcaligenes faecalis]|nr:hypothetical protein [Alcaligenes faecalis]